MKKGRFKTIEAMAGPDQLDAFGNNIRLIAENIRAPQYDRANKDGLAGLARLGWAGWAGWAWLGWHYDAQ